MASRNVPDSPAHDSQTEIPLLTSISPAIFVPTTKDFTADPPEVSGDAIAELENSITQLEKHGKVVEQQMYWMLEREAERIRRRGKVPRSYYDSFQRFVKEPRMTQGSELRLEELMLREGREEIEALLELDGDDRKSSTDLTPQNPSVFGGPWQAPGLGESKPPATFVDEAVPEQRMPPRTVASSWVCNEISWGWKMIEGHASELQKEKNRRRNALLQQNTRPLNPQPTHRPPTPLHRTNSMEDDVEMDLDD